MVIANAGTWNKLQSSHGGTAKSLGFFDLNEEINREATFSMHYIWLRFIADIRVEFANAIAHKDLDRAFDMLYFMKIETAGKFDNSDIENELVWIEKAMNEIYICNTEGEVCRINMGKFRWVKTRMLKVSELIVQKLEAKGLLSMADKNPRHAMGNFGTT